ncbi:hypothetical protein BJ742DRAFT_821349 [Cladochytrium replicatum]|nr:hypothetical protein BJ742DRAFT_821349 [Cladochytrium replicatum]
MDDAGVSLRTYVGSSRKRGGSDSQLWTLIQRILVAISSAHAQNWTHGQISPDTVFILEKSVRLIDWSNAAPIGDISPTPHLATEFTAPESTVPRATATSEADIFSAGKVIEWLLNSHKIAPSLSDSCRSTIREHLIQPMTNPDPSERPAFSTLLAFIQSQVSSSPGKLSLAEKALGAIVNQINLDPDTHMSKLDDDRGGVVFSSVFEKLHYLAALYLLEHGYANEDVFDGDSLHAYHDKREHAYREMFAVDRDNDALEDPYLMLNDVFGTSLRYTRQPLTEKESSYFFCFRDGLDNTPWDTDLVVPTLQDFETNFASLTSGLLTHIDWTHVFVAGGSVLASLTPNLDLQSSTFFNSDVDVFFTGLTLPEIQPQITTFCNAIERALDGKQYIAVRNLRSMTIVSEYPARQIQIVFRLFASPAEVLMGFDVDSCAFGYDGKKVWALPRALRALTKRCNVVDMTRRSASYEYRLMKYGKRGFAAATPGVDAEKVKRVPIQGDGLARLITMETPGFLTKVYHRKVYKKNKTKLDIAQLIAMDRETEVRLQNVDAGDYSHYQFLKIPYGPKWDLRRISKNLRHFVSRVKMGAYYGSSVEDLPYRARSWSGDRNTDPVFRAIDSSEALFQATHARRDEDDEDDYDDGYDVYPFDYQRNGINELLEVKLDHLSSSGGKIEFLSSWVTVNPGQQLLMTGSFEPIVSTFEEWVKDAYEGREYEPFAYDSEENEDWETEDGCGEDEAEFSEEQE